MIKLLKKYKLLVLIVLLGGLNPGISYTATNKCEQEITVNYIPYSGVKVYTISGSENTRNTGKDKRGIIDLGHFSGLETNKKLNIGTVEVTVEMIENTNGESNSGYEVEVVDINKLQNYVWNYKYDIASFVGKSDGISAKITVDNFKLSRATLNNINGTIIFSCGGENHTSHAKYLNYRFDLILELNNLQTGGMHGFSAKKEESDGAYVNIKDIVVDQLKGSATANAGNN